MSSRSRQLWKLFYSTEDDHIAADVQNSFACNEQELASPESFFDLPVPPDSFWVPKSHEKYWVDHHALVQRRSSKKLISFRGKSTHHPTNNSKSFSQRFSPSPSQKSKASFIGLPRTPKASYLVDGYGRHGKGGSARLFRSLSEPRGSLVLEVPEPDSPKVSCTGRVGAQKGKANKRSGFWISFKSILRTGVGANILAK